LGGGLPPPEGTDVGLGLLPPDDLGLGVGVGGMGVGGMGVGVTVGIGVGVGVGLGGRRRRYGKGDRVIAGNGLAIVATMDAETS
jgi:hypothetical protein